uniref:C3HC-type domain-containing protein n=1 Tax=Kalanchoe fedtschenkoi TaxID=63787 RepID=A0A7N0REM5_KALFE
MLAINKLEKNAPRNHRLAELLTHYSLFLSLLFRKHIWGRKSPTRKRGTMKEEVISSGGNIDATPAASSAGASSPAAPANRSRIDLPNHGYGSKAGSFSNPGSPQRRTSLSTNVGGSTLGVSHTSCRPWERGDLLRRLATFKPSNWFGKPKIACSLACAQKGWMSADMDKIICESCGVCLSFVTLQSWSASEAEGAGEAFFKKLDDGHKMTCPWRGNSCPESLVQFPPTPQSALVGGYKDRCDGLLQFQCLPIVAASAIELIRGSRGPQIDRLLSQPPTGSIGDADYKADTSLEIESSRDDGICLYFRAQKIISLCGWEPRWLSNIQDCEEHSAQSARNGYSFGPSQIQRPAKEHALGKNVLSMPAKKDTGKTKILGRGSRCESRSPLLDCSLCGATVRILDFLTVPRPGHLSVNIADIPDTSKKMAVTRGASAASGINGWVPADEAEKEQVEEVATTNKGKSVANSDVDLNLTMAGGLFCDQLGTSANHESAPATDIAKDLIIGQPSGSEVGDRAASYESRGPSSRKRRVEKGGSSNDRPPLRMQQADSVEGTVIDRDADEVTDLMQYSSGPSKRARDTDFNDTNCSSYQRGSSAAGPSNSMGIEMYAETNRFPSFQQEIDYAAGFPATRDSTRASSVIAMDTICHSADDDSMESVENFPGNLDDVHFPSSSNYGNLDMNETSDLNYSTQAQQSICFQPGSTVGRGEMGGSTTNDGEELFNVGAVTPQAMCGISFGVSGGSVGMCASHEAEIHGTDASVHRTDSMVGDMEPRIEDAEHQGQTGESVPDPGIMDEIVPEEINQEDPNGDSQELLSRSVGRADSGSKIGYSAKADSVESGDKTSESHRLGEEQNAHPSLSCNAMVHSGCDTSKKEVTTACNIFAVKGFGPPKGENSYEELNEFDPIIHHNQYCPWVNGNVAAAGCSSPMFNGDDVLCGWQLTIDALEALRTVAVQIGPSESAASMYKDEVEDWPSSKKLKCPSVDKGHLENK